MEFFLQQIFSVGFVKFEGVYALTCWGAYEKLVVQVRMAVKPVVVLNNWITMIFLKTGPDVKPVSSNSEEQTLYMDPQYLLRVPRKYRMRDQVLWEMNTCFRMCSLLHQLSSFYLCDLQFLLCFVMSVCFFAVWMPFDKKAHGKSTSLCHMVTCNTDGNLYQAYSQCQKS